MAYTIDGNEREVSNPVNRGGGGNDGGNDGGDFWTRKNDIIKRTIDRVHDWTGGGDDGGDDDGGDYSWTGNPVNSPAYEQPEEPTYELTPAEQSQLDYAKKPMDVTPLEDIVNPKEPGEEQNKEEEPTQPVVTPPVQTKDRTDNDAFSSVVDSDKTKDETKFYTGSETEEEPASTPNTSAVPDLQTVVNPFPKWNSFGNAGQIDNPFPKWRPPSTTADAARAGRSGNVAGAGSAGTGGPSVLDNILAAIYNMSESEGWATMKASDAYGESGKLNIDKPGWEIADERNRNNILQGMLEIDKNLDVQHPDITGEDVRAAIEEAQRNAPLASSLLRLAKMVANPRKSTENAIDKVVVPLGADWVNAGNADNAVYSDAEATAQEAAIAAGFIPGTPGYDNYIREYLADNPPAYGSNSPNRSPNQPAVERPSQTDIANYIAMLRSNPFARDVDRSMGTTGFNTRNALVQYAVNDYNTRLAELANDTYVDANGNIYRRNAEGMFVDQNGNPLNNETPVYRVGENPPAETENVYSDLVNMDTPGYVNGKPNEALEVLMDSINYYDDNGLTVFRDEDGTYRDVDGNIISADKVHRVNRYSPDDIYNLFLNYDYGKPGHEGEYLFRGMEWMNDLTEEERRGINALLNTGIFGGSGLRDINRNNIWKREIADMTAAEYNKFADMFLEHMPALRDLMKAGLLDRFDENGDLIVGDRDSIKDFFFKAFKGEVSKKKPKPGSGYGYGGGRRGGGGGGRGGGGYYGGGGGGSSSGSKQNENRVYNIMKNWSF